MTLKSMDSIRGLCAWTDDHRDEGVETIKHNDNRADKAAVIANMFALFQTNKARNTQTTQ